MFGLQPQDTDRVFTRDLLEDRFADFAFSPEIEEKIDQGGSQPVRAADVGPEEQPVLEFVQELHRIFRIAFERVAAGTGGKVAVKIPISPLQVRDRAFFP